MSDESKVSTVLVNINNSVDINLHINNVVCSFSTECYLNLKKIAMQGMHVEYRKENGMLNMKLRKPYTTASIWSSGKITITGSKSESDAYIAARRYSRLLQKMQFKVTLSNYRIVNVLASCNMPFSIDLVRIADTYQKECCYEPELHPGATFKIEELKSTLKLFNTGSVTLTAPSIPLAKQAILRMYPILLKFRRGGHPKEEEQIIETKIDSIVEQQQQQEQKPPQPQSCITNEMLFNQISHSSPTELHVKQDPLVNIPSTITYENQYKTFDTLSDLIYNQKQEFFEDVTVVQDHLQIDTQTNGLCCMYDTTNFLIDNPFRINYVDDFFLP